MFYVYVIKNFRNETYIGYTADIDKRIKAHNYGMNKYTKLNRPWFLVYYEAYLSKEDAKNREKILKNYGSTLGHLKKRIQKSLALKNV